MRQRRIDMEILERLCSGELRKGDYRGFHQWLDAEDFSWGQLLESAVRHKVLPMLAHAVLSQSAVEKVPRFVGELMSETLRVNQHRLKVFRGVAARVLEAFEENGLPVASTKGLALESIVYGDRGLRGMWDIDFMIDPEDRKAVSKLLAKLGFEPGYLEWQSGDIHRLSRRELLAYELNPDHLPPQVLGVDDDILPCVNVDVACSFTWHRCEYSVPVEPALARRTFIEVPGLQGRCLPVLATDDHFIFIALHLFREAWIETWVSLEQDVNLVKFGDMYRFFHQYQDELTSESFRIKLKELDIAKPLAWVTSHLDSIFSSSLTSQIGISGEADAEWLGSAGGSARTTRKWSGDMRERLASTQRASLFREVEDEGPSNG